MLNVVELVGQVLLPALLHTPVKSSTLTTANAYKGHL